MSTLIKLITAMVLSIVNGQYDEASTVQVTANQNCTELVEQLNPHFIITRDELLSHQNMN